MSPFVIIGVFLVLQLTEAHDDDNTYTPLIRFLKELRKARKNSDSLSSLGASTLPIKNDNSRNSYSNLAPAASSSDDSSIRVGIGSSGSNSNNGNNNGNFNNYPQLEQTLQQISSQLPTQPPYPIERVNNGLRTLLGGVNSGSLADILRGSFMFTRNENVQSVANTVIDSIFGKRSSDPATT